MSYNIIRFSGAPYAVIADGTVDTTLDVTLIGKNYAGYGGKQNENFLYLLENFADTTPSKLHPISGQLWFNSSTGVLKINLYDGSQWKTLAVNDIASSAPSNRTQGDLWYNTTTGQLNVLNASGNYDVVGPQKVEGFGITQMQSINLQGKPVQEAIVDNSTIFTISNSNDFVTSPNIAGFPTIYKGVTLNTDYKIHGTVTNADTLGPDNRNADFFAPIQNPTFTTSIQVADSGVLVGTSLRLFNNTGTPTIKNPVGSALAFQTTTGVTTNTPLQLVDNSLLPGTTLTTNIGSSTAKFYNIYANYMYATALQADALAVAGAYRMASTSGGKDTVAVRDGDGYLTAPRFIGKSDDSTHADQADNATHADRSTNADQADLVTWDNVSGKPSNIVYADGSTYNIGIDGNAYTATTATHVPFSGITDTPTTLAGYGITDGVSTNALSNSSTITADANASINTILLRDDHGNGKVKKLYADSIVSSNTGSLITGTWTLDVGSKLEATYADLAERFEADDLYDTGTVVELGGSAEITAVKEDLSSQVFGVVSTSAAYLMNSKAGTDATHPAIAVSGRVPVKVKGKVKKGDRLVSAGNGMARAAEMSEITAFNTIGRALKDKNTDGTGTVEAIVTIK